MPETHWLTPQLMLGRVPAGIARAVRTTSPTTAVKAIEAGQTAVLPAGDWEGAKQVMGWIGMDPQTIADRIEFATTGFIR